MCYGILCWKLWRDAVALPCLAIPTLLYEERFWRGRRSVNALAQSVGWADAECTDAFRSQDGGNRDVGHDWERELWVQIVQGLWE